MLFTETDTLYLLPPVELLADVLPAVVIALLPLEFEIGWPEVDPALADPFPMPELVV